ncbi:DinB family protein [Kitasatospora sp. NPDC052896]|uniref:DinB family protein n=1 Tax=Kitasatospora sp. NPDC052896 TaxID=3364061 RepID=UPI0037C7F16F
MTSPDALVRTDPPPAADERATLLAFLDYHRATLARKCAELTDEQLRHRAVPPSTLSLLGLVRHLAAVERHWFQEVLLGERPDPLYWSPEQPDGDFDDVDTADPAEAFATWRREVELADRALRGLPLERVAATGGRDRGVTLRWILTHLIEEYARHNGHADLLREAIDGRTGE